MSEVTTASGTFIIHHEEAGRSEAKKICERENTILAPITNQADKDAIMKLINSSECPAKNMWSDYLVGLEIAPSCKNKKKIFSNGVEWNDKLHSHLYTDLTTSEYALAVAEFVPIMKDKALRIVDSANDSYCDGWASKFICLRETKKPARARGLIQEENESVLGSSMPKCSYMLNFVLVTFFVVLFVQKHYRKKTILDL